MGHYRIIKAGVQKRIEEMDLGREAVLALSGYRDELNHALHQLGDKEIFAADAQDPLGFETVKNGGERQLIAAIHHIDEAMAAVADFLRWLESVVRTDE